MLPDNNFLEDEMFNVYRVTTANNVKQYVIKDGVKRQFSFIAARALCNKQNNNNVDIVLHNIYRYHFEKAVKVEVKSYSIDWRISFINNQLLDIRDKLSMPNRNFQRLQALQTKYRLELKELQQQKRI